MSWVTLTQRHLETYYCGRKQAHNKINFFVPFRDGDWDGLRRELSQRGGTKTQRTYFDDLWISR